MKTLITALLSLGLMTCAGEPSMADEPEIDILLLDDFQTTDGRSAYGTSWQGFTDRVMGGRSDLQAGYIETDRGPAVRMEGTVRLDNNGGFVQIRLPLADDRQPLDASGMSGFVVEARGAPGPYYLHLRTTDTRRPWAYYRAPLKVTGDWQTIEVPLAAFEAVSTRRPMDASRLMSVGLVAYGEEFDARLDVRHFALKARVGSSDSDTGDDR